MTRRERVIQALQMKESDRPPFQATFCPEFAERLRKAYKLNLDKPHDPHSGRWNGYELEILTGQDALQAGIGWFTNYYLNTEPYTDEWGIQWKIDEYKTPFGKGRYTNIAKGPLEDDAAIENYNPPDPYKPELYTNLERLVREYKHEWYIIGRLHCTIFETAWALRGFENLLTDFFLNPDLAVRILNIAKNYHLAVAKEMALQGVDMIWLGDDLGGQDALLIPPDLWTTFIKPGMKEIISSIRIINPDIKIAYHTDGNNYDIIPELIETGVDVLNPIQAESMDPVILKEKYGDRLAFYGAISVQSTLPFGSPEDVKNEFLLRKNTIGKNGGWICAPTHHVQLDTPMENFFALLDSIGVDYTSP
jgi:uroporphyrinogen decarboxylase